MNAIAGSVFGDEVAMKRVGRGRRGSFTARRGRFALPVVKSDPTP